MIAIAFASESRGRMSGTRRPGSGCELNPLVLVVCEDEIPEGSLWHGAVMMLPEPGSISRKWRIWGVAGRGVIHSLYKESTCITCRVKIEPDGLKSAQELVDCNRGYAHACVTDICRTESGLRLPETNCINAAGFYAADLEKMVPELAALNRD
ncbi:ATP-grasp domain-containing protein [Roseibium sp. RKSG952]|uniref:ATP-grasp domain-containing protein n=1 Tax=Roseibium sp. RKSG952 TaxID=2529384 RepID=UPI0012BBB151|nr:DUF4343 domain-containing protein [Roseibium sp. RKSG952]